MGEWKGLQGHITTMDPITGLTMTTIVFDGKTLVADTRSTRWGSHIDTSVKIHRVENATYKGEPILVVAGAGSVKVIDAVIPAFINDPDGLEDAASKLQPILDAIAGPRASCRVLVVTSTQVYCIHGGSHIGISKELPRPYPEMLAKKEDVFVAIGSGAPMASALRTLFNLPLHLCVGLLAGVKQAATGGLITIAEFGKNQTVRIVPKTYASYAELHAEAVEHLRSKGNRYLGEMPPIFGHVLRPKKTKAPVKEKPVTKLTAVSAAKKARAKRKAQ